MFEASITPEMHYDDWANVYDSDIKGWDYAPPKEIANVLKPYIDTHGKTPAILDVGIGTGNVSQKIKAIRPGVLVSGVDVSQKMLDLCHKKGIAQRLSKVDISCEKMPFADESFDFVVAGGVMENVENAGNAVQEMCRVLKPGGYIAYTYVPAQRTLSRDVTVKNMRPGRTQDGRFVMGQLALFGHNALKMKVYASAMGVTHLKTESFVGYRTYVFLTVKYNMFVGYKKKT